MQGPGDARPEALPDARRRTGERCASRQSQCLAAWRALSRGYRATARGCGATTIRAYSTAPARDVTGGNGMSGCGDDGLCDWRAPEEGDTELECERCGRKLARRIIHPDEQTAILVWAEHFKGGAERFAEFFAPVELLRERVRERARRRLQAVREQPDHTENIRGNGEKN